MEKAGRILEKAADVTQATEMLTMLSGDTHEVHTGSAPHVCLFRKYATKSFRQAPCQHMALATHAFC